MEHDHCSDLLRSIEDYLDGDIQPEVCSQLEEHLRGCQNCRIVVDTLRKTISLYHDEACHEMMPEATREHLYRELNLLDFLPHSDERK
jgi:predicted anti-sigma-YlaC factor YlaD